MKSRILVVLAAIAILASGCNSVEKIVAKSILKAEIEEANKDLSGKYVDEITIMSSCEFDGKNIFYNYEIDEELVSLDDIDISILEDSITEEWKTNPDLKELTHQLNILEGSAIYSYTGSNTGESFSITIHPPKGSGQ